jgi:hypothetical protein
MMRWIHTRLPCHCQGRQGPETPCMQVADIEASQADHCKLYIHTKLNNITYRMKAETT